MVFVLEHECQSYHAKTPSRKVMSAVSRESQQLKCQPNALLLSPFARTRRISHIRRAAGVRERHRSPSGGGRCIHPRDGRSAAWVHRIVRRSSVWGAWC